MKIKFSTALKRLGPLLRVIQACFSALVPENLIHNFTVPKLLQVLWTTISPPALLIEGALVVEDLLVLLLFRFLKRLGKAQAKISRHFEWEIVSKINWGERLLIGSLGKWLSAKKAFCSSSITRIHKNQHIPNYSAQKCDCVSERDISLLFQQRASSLLPKMKEMLSVCARLSSTWPL